MKVLCVAANAGNGDTEAGPPGLRLGAEYVVLELSVGSTGVLLRIESEDDGTPGLYPLGAFAITDPTLPGSWVVASAGPNAFELTTAAWARAAFWEEYFDGVQVAVDVYERDRLLLLRESSL